MAAKYPVEQLGFGTDGPSVSDRWLHEWLDQHDKEVYNKIEGDDAGGFAGQGDRVGDIRHGEGSKTKTKKVMEKKRGKGGGAHVVDEHGSFGGGGGGGKSLDDNEPVTYGGTRGWGKPLDDSEPVTFGGGGGGALDKSEPVTYGGGSSSKAKESAGFSEGSDEWGG